MGPIFHCKMRLRLSINQRYQYATSVLSICHQILVKKRVKRFTSDTKNSNKPSRGCGSIPRGGDLNFHAHRGDADGYGAVIISHGMQSSVPGGGPSGAMSPGMISFILNTSPQKRRFDKEGEEGTHDQRRKKEEELLWPR